MCISKKKKKRCHTMNENINLILLYVFLSYGFMVLARPPINSEEDSNHNSFQEENINSQNNKFSFQKPATYPENNLSQGNTNDEYPVHDTKTYERNQIKSKNSKRKLQDIKYEDNFGEDFTENIEERNAEDYDILSSDSEVNKPLNTLSNKSSQLLDLLVKNISNCSGQSLGNVPMNLFFGDNISITNYIVVHPDALTQKQQESLCETTPEMTEATNEITNNLSLEPISTTSTTKQNEETTIEIISTLEPSLLSSEEATSETSSFTESLSTLDSNLITSTTQETEEESTINESTYSSSSLVTTLPNSTQLMEETSESLIETTTVTNISQSDIDTTLPATSESQLTVCECVPLTTNMDNMTTASTSIDQLKQLLVGAVGISENPVKEQTTPDDSTCDSDFVDNSLKPIGMSSAVTAVGSSEQSSNLDGDTTNTIINDTLGVSTVLSNSITPTIQSSDGVSNVPTVSLEENIKKDESSRIRLGQIKRKPIKPVKIGKNQRYRTKKRRHGNLLKFAQVDNEDD